MDKEKFYAPMGGRSLTASSKRSAQLRNWDSSATNKESDAIKPSRLRANVQFGDTVVFLAAAMSGDVEDVERLVAEGADVNAINSDGLTGLHQCCIDDDFQMVQTLVQQGAIMDLQDNEGWSPLHAATSCGHEHIVRYLLEQGAHPALVNNEGDTPLDLAEDQEEIESILATHIETHNIDIDGAKNQEEVFMLEDANKLLNDSSLSPPTSPGGASLLHVAAAKGYLSVMGVLMEMKVDIDVLDNDGWTPLHAAVYWRNMEAAELLVSHGADITLVTSSGDTIEDLVDPELADGLDSLKKITQEANNRHRHYAVPRSSRPSLSHSNSREDIKSPNLLRRRSSKERSLAVHKLDKEREKFPEIMDKSNHNSSQDKQDNSVATSNGPVTDHSPDTVPKQAAHQNTISSVTQSITDQQEVSIANHQEVSVVDEQEATKEVSQEVAEQKASSTQQKVPNAQQEVPNAQQEASPSVSPELSPSSSPQILAKMAPGTKTSPKIGTLISHVAPNHSLPLGKKGMSPSMLKRVGLWESQSNVVPIASSTPSPPETKRFPFQPNTISDVAGSRQNSKDKRASYDERKLNATTTQEYRTSSLPRGATITLPESMPIISTSLPRGSKINTLDKTKDRLTALPDETLEIKPKESVDGVSSSGTPTPGADTTGDSRELSAESINRSGTESETKRKQQARRSRQQRHPTQPVDNEILQRLLAGDKLKEEAEESSPEIKTKSDHKSSTPRTPAQPQIPSLSVAAAEGESSVEGSPPVRQKLSVDDGEDDKTPSRSAKPKSSTRRRPRKDRRSTGLPFEAEEGEAVPEELANVIMRKSSEPSAEISSKSREPEDAGALTREKELRERVSREKEELSTVVDGLQNKVSELTRRHADARRAYEQEKRDGETKDARIAELEMTCKNLQDMKKECQRLKDENSALIRVIGKLSRSPLPSSTV